MTRSPRHPVLDSVVAVAAHPWSETVEVQDSLPTPPLLLVCTRWCLHQFREVTSPSPHKRSSVATMGVAALVILDGRAATPAPARAIRSMLQPRPGRPCPRWS